MPAKCEKLGALVSVRRAMHVSQWRGNIKQKDESASVKDQAQDVVNCATGVKPSSEVPPTLRGLVDALLARHMTRSAGVHHCSVCQVISSMPRDTYDVVKSL